MGKFSKEPMHLVTALLLSRYAMRLSRPDLKKAVSEQTCQEKTDLVNTEEV